jgi:hypothetical protein
MLIIVLTVDISCERPVLAETGLSLLAASDPKRPYETFAKLRQSLTKRR